MFNKLLTWSTAEFGGTDEGLSQFKRLTARIQSDPKLRDVKVTLRGHSGFVRATLAD
jgi:hypothetical protein